MNSEQPVLPYAGTSGWSGSDTSRERAEREDSNGTTSERQRRTLGYLSAMGSEGLTVADLRDLTGWHHGQASASLSVLHKAGRIARLAERRDRCLIYVMPECVGDRATQPHRPNRRPVLTQGMVESIVKDCIYEARNNGLTIGSAAREAANQIMQIMEGQK